MSCRITLFELLMSIKIYEFRDAFFAGFYREYYHDNTFFHSTCCLHKPAYDLVATFGRSVMMWSQELILLESLKMKPVANEVVEKQLEWRYATKAFDAAKVIPDADWKTLEQALVLTPSSFGLQPWKFFVVTDPAKRALLRPASWGQSQIVDASHLVVFAIRKNLSVSDIERFVARTAEVRGTTVESLESYRQMMVGSLTKPSIDINAWASRQVYIALGFFMSAQCWESMPARSKVLNPPSTMKSWACRHWATVRQSLQQPDIVPVLINMRHWPRSVSKLKM